MKKTLILLGFLALAPFAKGQLLLEALEGGFTPSEKCLERVYDKHYGDGVHNYIYCAVQGPNGKKWLNLNLGAEYAKESSPHFNPEAVPTDFNDWKAFGNLYQWGRGSDGHEQVEYRQGSQRWEFRPINGVRSNFLFPGETSNQMVVSNTYDSYQYLLGSTWQNDPCPDGYHIATSADATTLGRIDQVLGSYVNTSIFKFENAPQLRLVTAPTFIKDYGSPSSDGFYQTEASSGDVFSGTSSVWLKDGNRPLYLKDGNWIPSPEGKINTDRWYLDRGLFYGYGLVADLGITQKRRANDSFFDEEDIWVAALAIRCVQN